MNIEQISDHELAQSILSSSANFQHIKNVQLTFDQRLMKQFEFRYTKQAGAVYIIAFIGLIGTAIVLHDDTQYLREIPFIQILFLSLLFSLIVNYNYSRKNQCLLHLQDENLDKTLKVVTCSLSLSFVSNYSIINIKQAFILAFKVAKPNVCLFIYFSSWVISLLFELNIQRERYTEKELLSLLGLSLGFYLCTQPDLLGDHVQIELKKYHIMGVFLSIKAAFLFFYGVSNLRTLCETSCLTIYHNIVFPILLVWSIMFTTYKSNFITWYSILYVLLIGFFLQMFGQFLIRGFQIFQTSKSIALLFLLGPFLVIDNQFISESKEQSIIGIIVTFIAAFYLLKDQEQEQQIEEQNKNYYELNILSK